MPAEISKTEVITASYDEFEPKVFHYIPSGFGGMWIQVSEDLEGVSACLITQERMDEINKSR